MAPRLSAPSFKICSLAKTARNLTLGDLKKLMGLSDDLARLTRGR